MTAWYAIKTRPKNERKALREIQKAGFEAYLPEFKIERFNRRLKVRKISTLCHFPRYLFARIELSDIGAVRNCLGVADVLPGFPLMPQPVDAKDVDTLREAQRRHLLDDTDEARRLRGETTKNSLRALRKRLRGKRVHIKDGAFYGYAGDVDAVISLERLRVTISIFGRETPVELEFTQIEELAA